MNGRCWLGGANLLTPPPGLSYITHTRPVFCEYGAEDVVRSASPGLTGPPRDPTGRHTVNEESACFSVLFIMEFFSSLTHQSQRNSRKSISIRSK